MEFKVKTPCAECPFRRDSNPFLRRAGTLAKQLADDHFWFACHHTTGVAHGKRVRPENQSQCAGSMGVLWRMGRPNIAMRAAILFGFMTIADVDRMARAKVFRNLQAFERHHLKPRR